MKKFTTFLFLFCCSATPLFAQDAFPHEKQIDALVQPWLEHEKINCISVGIILDGKTRVLNYGQLSESDDLKPDGESIYEIGSISKVFTSVLLADAVAREKARLDQPIGELMPGLTEANKDVGETITLQHLSNHMSGLPRMPDNLTPEDMNNPFAGYDRTKLVEFMKGCKPGHKANTHHEYSNLAAGLLGDLLSAQAEISYEELLKTRILDDLNMSDTSISVVDQKRLAPPHNGARMADHTWDFDALAGAGAIKSTANDMIRFMQANIDPPKNELGQAIELAWKQHLPAGDGHMAMGLGWMISGDGSTRWHNGQTGGYHSMMLVNRELNAGVILLCNTAGMDLDALAEGIFQTIVGMKVKPREFKKSFDVDLKTIERLTGKYQLAAGLEIQIVADGKKLSAQLTGQQALPVFAESDTVWNYQAVEAQLVFELPETGPCTQVTLHQNGREMVSPRIPDE